MATNGDELNYGLDIQTREAIAKVAELRRVVDEFGNNLDRNVRRLQTAMRKNASDYAQYIKDLQKELKTLQAQGLDTTAVQNRITAASRRQTSAENQARGVFATGGPSVANREAVLRSQIAEINAQADVIASRLSKAGMNAQVGIMRTTGEAMEAAIVQESRRINNMVTRSTGDLFEAQQRLDRAKDTRTRINAAPEVLAAGTVMAQRSAQDRIYSAQYGQGALQNRNTLQRLSDPSFLPIQGTLVANYAAISAAFGSARYLGRFVVELEKEFKNFQAITATTDHQMAEMEDRLISVSETTKFTALEVAQAATIMGQAGLSAQEVADSIEAVTLLATAAGTELSDAVGIVTSVLNVFDLQSRQTTDVANVMTAALNQSKLTLEQLTLGIQYAGNTAAQSGVTFNELTAILGALANSGIRSGSTLGTGLRQILVDLQTPTNKFKAVLDRLGLSLADIDVEANGFVGVLSNLMAAGFTTADAFESFEVRAAASFSALANNADVITDLQESFVLTNAAAEANEIQMDSLANTWKQFQSVIGTKFYDAFKPVLDLFQDILSAVSDVLTRLGEFPGVLQTAAALFAGLATGTIVSRLGGVIAAMLGISRAADTAVTSTNLLWRILSKHPIGAAIGVITSVAVAIYAWTNRTSSLIDEYDRLQTMIDNTNGEIDANTQKTNQIRETIDLLIRQQQTLDRVGNEGLRRAKIIEVKNAFTELAGEIDTNTGSIRELIEALVDLEAQMESMLPEQYSALASELSAAAEVLRQRIRVEIGSDNRSLLASAAQGQFGTPAEVEGTRNRSAASVFSLTPGNYANLFLDDIANLFGEQIARAAEIGITNDPNIPEDVLDLRALEAIVREELISRQRDLSEANSQSARQSLENEIALLEAIRTNLTEVLGLQVNLADNLRQQGDALRNEAQSRFNEEAAPLDANVISLEQTVLSSLRGVQDLDASQVNNEDIISALTATQNYFNQTRDGILTEAQALLDALVASGTISADQAAGVDFSQLETSLAQINSLITEALEEPEELQRDIDKWLLDREKTSIQGRIDTLLNEVDDALNEQQLDVIEQQVTELMQRLAEIDRELLGIDAENEFGGVNSQAFQQARNQLEAEISDRNKEIQDQIVDLRVELYQRTAQTVIENIEREMEEILAEMERLNGTIDATSTVETISSVGQSLAALWNRLMGLANQLEGFQDIGGGLTAGPTSAAGFLYQEEGFQTEAFWDANTSGNGGHYRVGFSSDTITTIDNMVIEVVEGMTTTLEDAYRDLGRRINEATNDIVRDIGAEKWAALTEGQQTALISLVYNYGSLAATGILDTIRNGSTEEVAGAIRGLSANPARRGREADLYLAPGVPAGAAGSSDITAGQAEIQAYVDTVAEQVQYQLLATLSATSRQLEEQLSNLVSAANVATTPGEIEAIIENTRAIFDEILANEAEAFEAAARDPITGALPSDYDQQLAAHLNEIRQGINDNIDQLIDQYLRVIEQTGQGEVQAAQNELAAAQSPFGADRYSESEIAQLQYNVALAERARLQQQINGLEQLYAFVHAQLQAAMSEDVVNMSEVNMLREREAEILRQLNELRSQGTAYVQAESRAYSDLGKALANATQGFLIAQGVMRVGANGLVEMVPVVEQVASAWEGLLGTLVNGFTQLFTNIVTGTMSAKEAFKQFAIQVLQYLIQVIAKALALQIIMAMFPGMSTGVPAGGGGDFLSALFAVVGGMANGYVPGAAVGYTVGGVHPRDGQLRRLMPGEAVLRSSAASALGQDALLELNNQGNRRISEMKPLEPANDTGGAGTVNVWVVSQDQVPPPGPNDIIAAVAGNIQNRGAIRQLIKQVQLGAA